MWQFIGAREKLLVRVVYENFLIFVWIVKCVDVILKQICIDNIQGIRNKERNIGRLDKGINIKCYIYKYLEGVM